MMGRENILIGISGVIIGVSIFFKTSSIMIASIPTLLGIALIFFYKEEDLIEKRRDK